MRRARVVHPRAGWEQGATDPVPRAAAYDGLAAEIRAALDQVPPPATAVIRVRYEDTDMPMLAVAEVWAISNQSGAEVRVCDLPTAIGLRMGLVEEGLDQAGVSYPRADLGLRARWRRLPSPEGQPTGHELVVSMSGHERAVRAGLPEPRP